MKQVDCPAEETFFSASPEETRALGEKTGRGLAPGSIVALRGNLGAGKTVFVKGLARALGAAEEVTSPTYTIISEYEGRLPLYHIDAYRLSGDEEFRLVGAEELLGGKGVCVIEWPERLSLPPGVLEVEIKIMEDGRRRIRRVPGAGG